MKRSQVEGGKCGHWEYEDQLPESGTLVQSVTLRIFGTTTTRRVRYLRTSSRDFTAGLTLVSMASRVDETCDTLQSARTDVLTALVETENRMTCLTGTGTNDKPGGSQSSDVIVTGVTDNATFVVHEDEVPVSEPNVVGGLSQPITSDSSPQLVPAADKDEPQQDYGVDNRDKENLDPLGGSSVSPRRSPLPEWFPRVPLQDITNVLALELDDEQAQPKKKRNKKAASTIVPTLMSLRNAPVPNAPASSLPKPRSCATPKQAYNLRKNFR